MSDRDPDCLFCKIVAGEIPSERVDEDERTVAFMDINPATRGHALVIPRRHAANLLEIDAEDLAGSGEWDAEDRLELELRDRGEVRDKGVARAAAVRMAACPGRAAQFGLRCDP